MGIGAGRLLGVAPSVHKRREITTIERPTRVRAKKPIKPMKARSKPAAVITGQMLGAVVFACTGTGEAGRAVISEVGVASNSCSIVVCRIRASKGFVKQVTEVDRASSGWSVRPAGTGMGGHSQARVTMGRVERDE